MYEEYPCTSKEIWVFETSVCVCVPSAMHDLMFLLRVAMKHSTSPFDLGQRGVIFMLYTKLTHGIGEFFSH